MFVSAFSVLTLGYSVVPQCAFLTGGARGARSGAASCVAAAGDLSSLGLTPGLTKTVKGFQLVPDQKLKYQQLLFLAKKCAPMDDALCVEANKVPGCLSTVFVHATADGEGIITFQGTSDAQLTKGLVALLVNGLSGCTAEQIEAVQPEFIQAAGLQQSLTPGRNNGFLNMLAMMKRKAKALDGAGGPPPAPPPSPPPPAARSSSPTMVHAGALGPIGSRMASTLATEFEPAQLRLVDESDQHAGHAGARGLNGESHFALHIVSEAFAGLRGLQRHQMIYKALGDDMSAIHALSIKALTPSEEAADFS